MSDVMLSTEGLFENPEFDTQFTEWQRTNNVRMAYERHFVSSVKEDFEDSNNHDTAEYIYQSDYAELDDMYKEILSPRSRRLGEVIGEVAREQIAAKTGLIEVGAAQGANQFALFSLAEYLHADSHDITRATIMTRVSNAEQRLLEVDQAVRNNEGELLTVVAGSEISAARLGVGGLTMVDRKVVFPTAEGRAIYVRARFSYVGDIHQTFEEPTLSLMGYEITSNDRKVNILESSQALAIQKLFDSRQTALLFGDVVEGPPVIGDEERDVKRFYHENLKRIRSVGHLAAAH